MRYVRKTLRALLATLPLLALPVIAQVPVGYVQVTGNYVGGQTSPVANGTIYFQPVNNSGAAIGYRIGQGYGAIVNAAISGGSVTGCSVAGAGIGYTAGATALISTALGSGAVITLGTGTGGAITSCTVTAGGSGYGTGAAPAVTVVGYGQATQGTLQAQVTNGAFTLMIPDTALTSPANVCFNVTVIDNVSGNSILGAGYSCVQPAGSGSAVTGTQSWCQAASTNIGGYCNFDAYPPSLSALAVTQTGPAGTISVVATNTLAPGTPASVTNAGTPTAALLTFNLPAGAAGATGATGPPITFTGPWSSTTAYAVGEGVSYIGQSYVALQANTNVTPVVGATWGILAAAGSASIAGSPSLPVWLNSSGAAVTFDPTQGGLPVPPLTVGTVPQPAVKMPTSGWSGYNGFGDSITFGLEATTCANAASTCWFWRVANQTGNGTQATNYGVSGDQVCDTVNHIFNDDAPTNSDLLLRTYEVSLNDADAQFPFGYMENFNNCQLAALTWQGIYAANKSLGGSQTPATNWTTDTTYAKDTFLTTSTFNSPQTWTVPYTVNSSWPSYSSPHFFMWYRISDPGGAITNPGIFTVSGVGNQVTVNTATAVPIATANGANSGIGVVDLGVAGGATRTITATINMVSATGTISIGGFGYNDPLVTCANGAASPCMWVAGTSRLVAGPSGNAESTSTTDQQVSDNVAYLNNVGFNNLYFAHCRNFWTNTTGNTYTDGKHPIDSGHAQFAACMMGPTAVPTVRPEVDTTVQTVRTVTAATACKLSSTDGTVIFNVTGSTAINCFVPATADFAVPPNKSKRITVVNLTTGLVTLTSPNGAQVTGTAIGKQVGPNETVTIEKDYFATNLRWNIVGSDPSVDLTCKVVTLPYTILDSWTDRCLVTGTAAGGVFTYPSVNTTSRHHIFVNAATAPTAAITFTGSGISGNGITTTLMPVSSMETVARTATLIDIVSQSSYGGFVAPTAVSTTHTLGLSESYLQVTASAGLTITLPTTWPGVKVVHVANQGTAAVNFTGATSGSANSLTVLPGQIGRLDYQGSGVWSGAVLWPSFFTSSSLGGSALTAGTCSSTTVAVAGAPTGTRVVATPNTYPGDGFYWYGYISASGTATVKVCASLATGTPTSSTYSVAVN